jgi:hypothetical protein
LFESEFVPLEFKKKLENALLLLDYCPAHVSVDVVKWKESYGMFLPKNTTALIHQWIETSFESSEPTVMVSY